MVGHACPEPWAVRGRGSGRYVGLINQHLPHWKAYRDQLNSAPLPVET